MKLYRIPQGAVVEHQGSFRLWLNCHWNALLALPHLAREVAGKFGSGVLLPAGPEAIADALAPCDAQEVWAAGVTYWRSREARMEESKSAGGGDFYDRVYSAARPELFFKSPGWRAVGPGQAVRIRRDSKWNVPEPELTLLLSAQGTISGYTIGNDMSSRDIEGENPLYLPQAKLYNGSCGLGPCILLTEESLPLETPIQIQIIRASQTVFSGQTDLSQIKRPLQSLADYLFNELSFPHGCFLMTGTGVVPPDGFTLESGDAIRITIPPIGELVNVVA